MFGGIRRELSTMPWRNGYSQQIINLNDPLMENCPKWARRHENVILLHDIASPPKTKIVQDKLTSINWDVLFYPLYRPDLTPSDYYLFLSIAHELDEEQF